MPQVSSRPFKSRAIAYITALAVLAGGSANAGTTVYKYDALNRLIEVDYPNGSKILYTYDSAGNCSSIVKST